MSFCALAGAGAWEAEGRSVSEPNRESAWFGALGARLAWRVAFGAGIHAQLHGDAVGAITRTSVLLDDGVVEETGAVEGGLGLLVGAVFR